MKILITPYTYAEAIGGVEVFSENLKKIFPDIITITNSKVNFNIPRFHRIVKDTLKNNDGLCSLLASELALQIVKDGTVEVVFINGLYGWYLTLKEIDVPTINILHGCYMGVANYALKDCGKLSFYYYKYYRGFLEYLSARGKIVVSVSEFIRDLLKQYYDIDSTVIPNGVDLKIFNPLEKCTARKIFGLPTDKKIGIFVGPLSHSKGFDVILKLAKKNPSIIFLVISPKKATISFFPNMIPYFNVSHLDMSKYYSAADFLILPSRFEGCNLSTLEAMACNVPILTSETGSFYAMRGLQPFGCVVPLESSVEDYQKAMSDMFLMEGEFVPRSYVERYYSFDLFESRYRRLVGKLINSVG